MTLPIPPACGVMTAAESDSCCAEWWRGLSRSHPGHLRARQSPAPGTAGPLTEPSEPLTEPSGALGSITTGPPPRGTAGPLREPSHIMTHPRRLPSDGDTPGPTVTITTTYKTAETTRQEGRQKTARQGTNGGEQKKTNKRTCVRATGHLFVCLDHITLRITLHTLHTFHTLSS